MKNEYIAKSLNYIQEKLSLNTLSTVTVCLIFISFILFDIYGHVFDAVLIYFSYWLLILIVRGIKKLTKTDRLVNVLHLILIIIAVTINIFVFFNIPHYTINQATKIVEKDLITKKGVKIQTEFNVRKLTNTGNLIVHEEYEIHLNCGGITYVYVFDPLKGDFTLTESYNNK